MKLSLTLIILTFCFSATAQELALSSDSDSTKFWRSWNSELAEELKIPPISISPHEEEFRFWDDYKVIQIWKSNEQLNATATFFLREYTDNERNEGRLFQSSMNIDERTTIAIHNIVEDFNILKLPTDSKISGWQQGLDGITYMIESKNADSYSFKNYWTPTAQENLKEARMIQYFVNEISNLTAIESAFKKFMSHQPFKSYYAGYGSAMIGMTIE